MAEVIWAIPALNDLEGILEFIEFDNPDAAKNLAHEIFASTYQLIEFPGSGSKPKELSRAPYRRMIVGPVKIYHGMTEQMFLLSMFVVPKGRSS
jgi:plasmid stabilization system protein ParE